ncbi:MAG TPA: amidohydrolase family protein, partial [Gemmatimonadota bacterium]|nr:amidohydrolase family protein [Gemmatimonadota bacterium]
DRSGYPEDGFCPEQRISAAEVLECYTLGAARAAGDADRRGRLAPGYDADFAAWDQDLATAGPAEILEANVVATAVAGEVVYVGQ